MILGCRRFILRVRSFLRAHDGVAAVEFALILPFLLTLYLGSVELSDVITVDRRLTIAAGSVGDLVSRTETTLTQSELDDYFFAAEVTMTPYDATRLMQVVTGVQVDADGVGTVVWSRARNDAVARTPGDEYPLPPETTGIIRDTFLVVSEAFYGYVPLTGYVLRNELTLYKEAFHVPRFGRAIPAPS